MASILDMVRAKKAQIQASSGRREKTHKPQPGKNRYRILPGWRKDDSNGPKEQFYRDFAQHFIKNEAGEIQAVVPSMEVIYGKEDPFADKLREIISRCTDDDELKRLKEMQAKGRVLLNALHLDGEDPTTPVPLDLTPTTFEKVLELIEEHGEEMLDLENGVDIIITRSGKGLNTEYSVMAAAKSKPVDKAVMSKIIDLDAYVNQEYESSAKKAIASLRAQGYSMGALAMTPSVAGALTGPASDFNGITPPEEAAAPIIEAEPVEETPAPATKAAPAEPVSKDDEFNDDLGEDDIEKLLGGLDDD